jgi:predicted ArsR family transcriptional regulator
MPNPENLINEGFEKHPERINKKGRPKKIPQLDVLLAEIFSEKEMTEILRALQKIAKKGNVKAAEVILDRAYGKAKQQLDITTDGEKINTIKLVRGNEGADNKSQ